MTKMIRGREVIYVGRISSVEWAMALCNKVLELNFKGLPPVEFHSVMFISSNNVPEDFGLCCLKCCMSLRYYNIY